MDNLDAARSHTYLSATCVHGECTNDPYAWCNDGTVRIRGGLSQKGLGNAQTRQGVGGLFFFRWPISRLEYKETAKERGETGRTARVRTGRINYDINDRFKNLFTTKLLLTRGHCLATL